MVVLSESETVQVFFLFVFSARDLDIKSRGYDPLTCLIPPHCCICHICCCWRELFVLRSLVIVNHVTACVNKVIILIPNTDRLQQIEDYVRVVCSLWWPPLLKYIFWDWMQIIQELWSLFLCKIAFPFANKKIKYNRRNKNFCGQLNSICGWQLAIKMLMINPYSELSQMILYVSITSSMQPKQDIT